jgi:hypothetical protein
MAEPRMIVSACHAAMLRWRGVTVTSVRGELIG